MDSRDSTKMWTRDGLRLIVKQGMVQHSPWRIASRVDGNHCIAPDSTRAFYVHLLYVNPRVEPNLPEIREKINTEIIMSLRKPEPPRLWLGNQGNKMEPLPKAVPRSEGKTIHRKQLKAKLMHRKDLNWSVQKCHPYNRRKVTASQRLPGRQYLKSRD